MEIPKLRGHSINENIVVSNNAETVFTFAHGAEGMREEVISRLNNFEALVRELERELVWLKHVKPQISGPSAVMLGFEQAIKAIKAQLEACKRGES